jgi:hypothetical protein
MGLSGLSMTFKDNVLRTVDHFSTGVARLKLYIKPTNINKAVPLLLVLLLTVQVQFFQGIGDRPAIVDRLLWFQCL